MKEYTLYLDESGNFEETGKYPSVVAGYLMDGNALLKIRQKKFLLLLKIKTLYLKKLI